MKLSQIILSAVVFFLLASICTSSSFVFAQASNQDKAQACKNLADKQNLTGDDRKTFMQNCLNKAAGNTDTNKAQQTANDKLNDASQQDKMNVCKNLADKKNLTGRDRASFLKDCMQKANPK